MIINVNAAGTITINEDGTIDPATAPIQREGSAYTLLRTIEESIVIKRSNIVFDGAGNTIYGADAQKIAIYLNNLENVIIKNTKVSHFQKGITLEYCRDITIVNCDLQYNDFWGIGLYEQSDYNNITGNYVAYNNLSGIDVYNDSTHNTIHNNTLRYNTWAGIAIYASHNNNITENTLENNYDEGILISDYISSDNTVFKNKIANNAIGIELRNVRANVIYNNEFITNAIQVRMTYDPEAYDVYRINQWDKGYTIGGNYWSDYSGVDANNDERGDSPYYIDAENRDRFPIVPTITPESTEPAVEEPTAQPEEPTEPAVEEPTAQPEEPTQPAAEEPTTQPEQPTESTEEQSSGMPIEYMLMGFLIAGVILAIIILLVRSHRRHE